MPTDTLRIQRIAVIALMAAGVLIAYESPVAISTAGVLLFLAGVMSDRWLPQ